MRSLQQGIPTLVSVFILGKGFPLHPWLLRRSTRTFCSSLITIGPMPAQKHWLGFGNVPQNLFPISLEQGAKKPTWAIQYLKDGTNLLNCFFGLPEQCKSVLYTMFDLYFFSLKMFVIFAVIKTFFLTKHVQRSCLTIIKPLWEVAGQPSDTYSGSSLHCGHV